MARGRHPQLLAGGARPSRGAVPRGRLTLRVSVQETDAAHRATVRRLREPGGLHGLTFSCYRQYPCWRGSTSAAAPSVAAFAGGRRRREMVVDQRLPWNAAAAATRGLAADPRTAAVRPRLRRPRTNTGSASGTLLCQRFVGATRPPASGRRRECASGRRRPRGRRRRRRSAVDGCRAQLHGAARRGRPISALVLSRISTEPYPECQDRLLSPEIYHPFGVCSAAKHSREDRRRRRAGSRWWRARGQG